MAKVAPYTIPVERPLDEYDDIAFAIRCLELALPRRLRREAGITQEELARRVGTYHIYIHHWERGNKRPDLQNLDRLACYGRELRRLAEETGIIRELSVKSDDPVVSTGSSR